MKDFTIYQTVSHILYRMGYKFLAVEALKTNSEDIKPYIKFIRLKQINNKSLVEFIDYYL